MLRVLGALFLCEPNAVSRAKEYISDGRVAGTRAWRVPPGKYEILHFSWALLATLETHGLQSMSTNRV